MEILESFFAKALKLESPWVISKVAFQEDKGVIKVFVDFPRGIVFAVQSVVKRQRRMILQRKNGAILTSFNTPATW